MPRALRLAPAAALLVALAASATATPPDPSTGTIEGRVVTREGRPLPGATVLLDEARETIAGPGGRFAFPDVLPGRHYLRAHLGSRADDLFVGVAQARLPRPGESVSIDITASRQATLELLIEPAHVAGHLLVVAADPTAGLQSGFGSGRMAPAIPGCLPGMPSRSPDRCWIDVLPRSSCPPSGGDLVVTTCFGAGQATVRALAPGEYDLNFQSPGSWSVHRLTLSEGPNTASLVLTEPGSIRGRVVAPDGSARRATVRIVATEEDQTYWLHRGCPFGGPIGRATSTNGAFAISGVPPGLWRIEAAAEGPGARGESTIEVRSGETTDAPIPLRPTRTVYVAADSDWGRLRLFGPPGLTHGGHLWIAGVAEEPPTTAVAWTWDGERTGRVDLSARDDHVALSMGPAATLAGVVLDSNGRPAGAGVQVLLFPDYDRTHSPPDAPGERIPRDPTDPLVTDIDGHFGPVLLSPAEWRIEVPGGESATLRVGLGETHDITLHLP